VVLFAYVLSAANKILEWSGINVIVFYISPVLEGSVGLSRNTAIIAGGCINLAFAMGSLIPALGADRLGRRKPMMVGSAGMGLSMMCVAILLSFNGTDKERITANASIAFFVTVSCYSEASHDHTH